MGITPDDVLRQLTRPGAVLGERRKFQGLSGSLEEEVKKKRRPQRSEDFRLTVPHQIVSTAPGRRRKRTQMTSRLCSAL